MNDIVSDEIQNTANKATAKTSEETPYLYKDAGILESHGKIPLWLTLVSIGLVLWSIYYTIKYWYVG